MMQRWELPGFGRDNPVLTSAPRPKPDPKEVLVKVEAVSLNCRDLVILENGRCSDLYPCLVASISRYRRNAIRA
jgi:NADPH:quinone reductase-like Zn-dependent oxidoreductase